MEPGQATMNNKNKKMNTLLHTVRSALDVVGLAVNATVTLWTPRANEKIMITDAFIKCRSKTGTVTANTGVPKGALQSNDVFISEITNLPIIEGDTLAFNLVKSARSGAVVLTIATDLITWVGHNLKLGDPVFLNTIATTGGITANTVYYAIPSATDSTKFQIATSHANALAGTQVDLITNDGTAIAYAGAIATQITNARPLKFKLVRDQDGADGLLYDVYLAGINLNR